MPRIISTAALLQILARLDPRIAELIGGGPAGPGGPLASRPRPEPWKHFNRYLGHPVPWLTDQQLSAVRLTRRIAETAALEPDSDTAVRRLSAAVDDLCGNEDPKFPFPSRWPVPDNGDQPPRPDEAHDAATVFAAAALSFAVLASGVRDEAMKQGLEDASERAAERAVGFWKG